MTLRIETEIVSFIGSIFCFLFFCRMLQLVCSNILFKSNPSDQLIGISQKPLLRYAAIYWLRIILKSLFEILLSQSIIIKFSQQCISQNKCLGCEITQYIGLFFRLSDVPIFLLFLIEIYKTYTKNYSIIFKLLQL